MIPKSKLHNTVIVETLQGNGSLGKVYGEPKRHRVLVESVESMVVDEGGNEVISGATVYMNPAEIPVGSRVTVWPDRDDMEYTTEVIRTHQYRNMRLEHTVLKLR